MQTFGDDVEALTKQGVIPTGAYVIDVKQLSILEFYNLYLDIKEAEDVIRKYFRQSVTSTVVKAEGEKRDNTEDDECVVCLNNKVNRLFRCKVRSMWRQNLIAWLLRQVH